MSIMAQQFRDLPQIPPSMDESDFTGWGFEHNSFAQPYKHAEYFGIEDDMCFSNIDMFDSGMVSMQPMQRFMLDQGPLSATLLNVKIPVNTKDERQYDQPWPSSDCLRNISPDRTTLSDMSSHATQNEFYSPTNYHVLPFSSPVKTSQSLLLYPTIENFNGGGYLSETQRRNISLRELEYEHPEPEAVPEETTHIDIKLEGVCINEHGNVKPTTTPDHKYADSGIGNSVRDAESVVPVDNYEEPASDSDYDPTPARLGKRQRSSAAKGNTRPRCGRKGKDSHVSIDSSPPQPRKKGRRTLKASRSASQTDSQSDNRRRFPCPLALYGCTSNFTSKNEWKRHINTQHIKLGYWRCDLCPPTIDPNDENALYYNEFNRKDLFTQHLRRMHAASKDSSSDSSAEYPVNEDNLAEHQTRCFLSLRTAPQQSSCLFCEQRFEGPTSWEERIEHVGRHLEKDRSSIRDMLDVASWNVDFGLEQYLLEEGLIAKEKGIWKIGNGKPRRNTGMESDDESEEE